MKRLYTLSYRGKRVADLYFGSKPEAKATRDALNKTDDGHVVSIGPDHWRTHERIRLGNPH
jgi:hypothetical protein